MVDETKHASPAAEDTSGTPSSDDVKQDGSGTDPQAVPYHRFQKKVWEVQDLTEKLHALTSRVDELQARPPAPIEEEAPDREDDPVGYAEHVANRAQRTAESATERLKVIESERERANLLQELQGEFATSVAKYPALDEDEDMREFAWEKFIMSKEQTQGRATGDDIMKGLHSRFQQYAENMTPGAKERRKLRGNPKRENDGKPAPQKKAWEKDREIAQGERPNMNGKISFSHKLDSAMRKSTSEALERMQRQGRRLSGT